MEKEITFSEEELVVSMTDLSGRITYCNEIFMTISGYNKKELLGRPHNILRHPDMPKAAFKLVWETISNGEEWSGLVKNKSKFGDFYWVYAHISAVMENNKRVGYLSVRRKPTSNEIKKYSEIYSDILKKEKGHKHV